MKTLSLLRHAKSDWSNQGLHDFSRPLNARGLRVAPMVGEWLKNQNITPDLIIASPAVRARMTIELIAKAADWNTSLDFDERIYEASVNHLLDVVRGAEDSRAHLLLVGHNPGIEELFSYLTHEVKGFPTACFASICLQRTETWQAVTANDNHVTHFLLPRTLGNT